MPPIIPPRRSILRTLKAGDSVVFHHAAGRQYCQSTLTTIQSSLETGRFSQRSAQIIDAGTVFDVTIVTCQEPIKTDDSTPVGSNRPKRQP